MDEKNPEDIPSQKDKLQITVAFTKVKQLHSDIDNKVKDSKSIDDLSEVIAEIKALRLQYEARKGYKWYWLLITGFVTGLLLYVAIIPGIEFSFVKTSDSATLKEKIQFIPATNFDDVIVDNFLIPAWDVVERKPWLYTKTAKTIEGAEQGVTLDQAALRSAVNPVYYRPLAAGDKTFISGNNIAASPALLSFLEATEGGSAQLKDINHVVSIGAVNVRPDKIPENIGLIEWASRVDSLTSWSKLHTQDYLLENIMSEAGKTFTKFNLPISFDEDSQLQNMNERIEQLIYLKNDMINNNRNRAEAVLEEIVKEKIKDEC